MADKIKNTPPELIACIISAVVLSAGIFTIGVMNLFCTDALYIDYSAAADTGSVIRGAAVFLCTAAAMFGMFKLSGLKHGIRALMAAALVLRLVSAFFWEIEPESDFLITLNLSELLAENPVSQWARLMDSEQTIYNTIWSAHMPFIVYQSLILRFIPLGAAGIRIVNAVISWLSCLIISRCAKNLYGQPGERFALTALGINPTVIFFIPVLTNQHIALLMAAAAAGVYYSVRIKNGIVKAVLIGVFIALSQLMRPEMQIVMIAALLCLVVDIAVNKKPKMKIVRFLCGAAVCAAIIFSVNNALVSGGLVHRDIYSGNLKYKIVMGLNKESAGTWNEEDSMLIYDEEALDDTLKERLNKPWKLVPMMFGKAAFQYGTYAYTWSFDKGRPWISQNIMRRAGQAVMIIVCAMAVYALVFRKRRELMPVYFSLAGYICAYALIEVQNRYNFLMLPFIVLIACGALKKKNTAQH